MCFFSDSNTVPYAIVLTSLALNALVKGANLNLDLAAGQNVAIIGPVGAGKTSLLMLVLGEMPVQQGEVRIKKGAQIVYAEQEPLIVTGTVESNILFGLKMDRQWYNEVVHACCLDEDFPALAAGD